MATIKFGEEPTSVEQRSAFCQLKDGAKIPGYRGFCPEYQFSFGKTFSEATRRRKEELQGCGSKSHHHNDLHSSEEITVPENNGFNKYTTGMVSGYTGYIPKRAQQFGRTYTEECTNCFKEHFRGMEEYKKDERQVLLNGGKFQPLRSEDDIAEHMKHFSYNQLMDKDFSRGVSSTKAPISGYTGHIPKKDRTEIGLGTGFDLAASKSLDSFNLETKYYKDKVDFYGNDRICCCRHFSKQ